MDLGVKQNWLLPLVGEVIPWKSQKQLPHGRVKRPLPPDNIPINLVLIGYYFRKNRM